MALNRTIHKNILVEILKDIYADTNIASFLGFKGGTAALLFYELDRFSVDLDFDVLDANREEFIFQRTQEILQRFGVLKEAAKKRYNLLYILSYTNKTENAQNIKVEMNRRNFGAHYDIKSYLGISMQVMTQADMTAHKLLAMYERIGRTNRDIYDAWFFLKNHWPINHVAVEQRAGCSLAEFLEKCITALEQFPNNTILNGLGELLDEKQKIWVKAHLKEDTLFLLKLQLEQTK